MKPAKSSAAVILATLLMGFRRSVGSRGIPSEPERLSEKDPIRVSVPVEIEIYHYYRGDSDDLEEFKEEMEEAFNTRPLLQMAVATGDMPQGLIVGTSGFGAGIPAFINEVVVGVRLEIEDLWKTLDRKVEEIHNIDNPFDKLFEYDCRYGSDGEYDESLYEELTNIPHGLEEGWFDRIIAEDPAMKGYLEGLGEHGFTDGEGYIRPDLPPKLMEWVNGLLDGAIQTHSENSPGDFLIARCVSSGIQRGTIIKGRLVFSLRRNPRLRTEASTDTLWRLGHQLKQTAEGLEGYLKEKWFKQWNGHSPLEWMAIDIDFPFEEWGDNQGPSPEITAKLATMKPHGKVRRR